MLVALPPQHLGEQAGDVAVDPATVVLRATDLSGASLLAAELDPGSELTVDAAGVLGALAAGRLLGRRFADGSSATAIELPYALRYAPASPGGPVQCVAPAHATASAAGVTALWQARLRGAPLQLAQIEDITRPSAPADLPLSDADRQAIVDNSASAPATAARIDLSCLGGSLTARGDWASFDWDHDAALGRDHHVQVVMSGVLYPFGHRAVYVKTTDREVLVDAAGPVALLRTSQALLVTEPRRDLIVADDPRIDRRFPFDAAEVTTTTFPGLGTAVAKQYLPPTPDLSAKTNARTALETERDGHLPVVNAERERFRAVDELGIPAAGDFLTASADLEAKEAALGEGEGLEARAGEISTAMAEIQRSISEIENTTPQLPEGGFPPDVEEQLRQLGDSLDLLAEELAGLGAPGPNGLAALRSARDTAKTRVDELRPIVEAEQARVRSVEEVRDAGGTASFEAGEVIRLIGEIAVINDEIRQIEEAATNKRDWILGLRTSDGQPLRVPLVCSSPGRPALRMDVAVLFVVDFSLAGDEFFPAFKSLTDPQVLPALDEQFALLRDVAVPATTIDVVRAPTRGPADEIEVHGVSLDGIMHGGRFVPQLAELQIAIPALRSLLGPEAQGALRTVELAEDLIENGPDADLVLKVVGDSIDVDFTAQADVSGGLLAPRLLADGISRLNGPVTVAGMVGDVVTGDLDPRKVLAEGASLLGFDLRDLIKGLGAPPSIVETVVDGRPPTVEMTWTGVLLQDVGPFVARAEGGGEARLDLTVTSSLEGSTTECTVTDFALHFPPGAGAVLQLSFRQVRFHQELGRDPDLKLSGPSAKFVGNLRLLEDLQRLVDLGGAGPVIRASTSGVSARYGLALPSAGAGVFQLRNIAVNFGLDVPFAPTDDDPIALSIGFASRKSPFNLSVLLFGGGGYVEMVLDRDGPRQFELSLEFGAATSISFAIATAEVHALGGVRALVAPDQIIIVGFLRFGGSVELLGLVTVSVELVVELRYDPPPANRLFGRATLVIEIDLTLYSDKFELDSGEWELVGSGGILDAAIEGDGFEEWQRYRSAFQLEDVA